MTATGLYRNCGIHGTYPAVHRYCPTCFSELTEDNRRLRSALEQAVNRLGHHAYCDEPHAPGRGTSCPFCEDIRVYRKGCAVLKRGVTP